MIMNFIFIIRNSLYRSKVPLQTWHCNVDILYKISNEVGDRHAFCLCRCFPSFCACVCRMQVISAEFKRIHVLIFSLPYQLLSIYVVNNLNSLSVDVV